jgi:hypothetical protein
LGLEELGLAPQSNITGVFLQTCFSQHQQVLQKFQQTPPDQRDPVLVLSAQAMEFGPSVPPGIDTNRFFVPVSLLQKSHTFNQSPMLPLLRCLGIPNAMRLVAALMSERRILLISSSATRLATCCRAALAILSQGLLQWQHFLLPVLPPHLFQYLQAPFPYLIGILQGSVDVNQIPELGEVLLIELDRNELETRNIPTHLISTRLPDMFGLRSDNEPNNSGASDVLAQDLMELLKADKKAIFGESSFAGEQAAKAAKAVKNAFGRLREQGRKLLNQNSSGIGSNDYDAQEADDQLPQEVQQRPPNQHAVTEDEIYTEGCSNQLGEEEARVAFCTFFLCLYGDLRWYLAGGGPGQAPHLDRDRFLQQKRMLGDGEGTPLFPLLQNMCQSQMFEQFVNSRIEEIGARTPVTKDSPLFSVCSNYHRQHNVDFSVMNVRRVTRQVSQANPSRLVSGANASARRMAMSLTSNKGYEGDHGQAVAQLVEYCHETSILMDVMSVMWMRLRDCRGALWKHGLLALQILRNLLYHGPVAAIAEATDGIDKIRQMKTYKENMRGQICQSIQQAAAEVYNLLVDRAKLMSIRRFCANRRVQIRENKLAQGFQQDRNLTLRLSFKALHPYLHPQHNRQVAPANIPYQPPSPSQYGGYSTNAQVQSQRMPPQQMPPQQPGGPSQPPQQSLPRSEAQHSAARPQQPASVVDLLDLGGASSAHPPPGQHPQQTQQQVQAALGSMSITDPFAASLPPPSQPQPTFAQIPPQQIQPQVPPPQQMQPPVQYLQPGQQLPPQQQRQPPPQQPPPQYQQQPHATYGQQGFVPQQGPPQCAPQPTMAQIPQYPHGQGPSPGQVPPAPYSGQPVPYGVLGGTTPVQVPPLQILPQGHPGYPPQQQQPPQQSNLFAAAPQQPQPPTQQPKPGAQFDPMSTQFDPFAR